MQTPSFRLDGMRALVVGASSGIGQGCAVALGEYGAEVLVAARREIELMETVAMIEAVDGRADRLVMDAYDTAACEAMIAAHGPFDILVNAAGLARHSAVVETSEEDFDAVADLNFKAAYFLSRAAAKGLIAANKPGSIINISSQMGHIGGVDRAVYAATKHAVEGMTKSMAIEWGAHGVRVNTICPTFIRTALAEVTLKNPERAAWIESKIKLGRIGEVEDIMGAVVFLASDASALVTGSALMIDGGWTAG